MEEIRITTAKMKGLHDALASCPEAQNAIRNVFPEAFEKEWKDITREIDWKIDNRELWMGQAGGFLRGYYKGEHLMTASKQRFEVSPMSAHYGSPDFKIETSSDKHTIWARE